ncbi:hypothetical protein M0805_003423 [Coniferiporia weirii]|nr:hypothetical protein M0805_003423 [Coniferiporia weirii]
MWLLRVVSLLVLLVLRWSASVLAFNFSYGVPTQCDSFDISWSGGRGPYSLLIIPFFNAPQNISLPDSAFDESSGNGSFSIQLVLNATQQFILTMSDATGFATGGISSVLTVDPSSNGTSCNTTKHSPDFTFQLNSALQQCRTFTFEGYEDAIQPVRILGLIPLGQAFELDPPQGPTSFDWLASVTSGTSITFIMSDSEGRTGGSSDLRIVGDSDDSSCISATSPHSTLDASSMDASSIQTGVPSATETVRAKAGSNAGAITGAVLGGVAFIALVLLSLIFCSRRQRGEGASPNTRYSQDAIVGPGGSSRVSRARSSFIPSRMRRAPVSLDLLPPSARSLHQSSFNPQSDDYIPSPFIMPSSVSTTNGHSAQLPSGVYIHGANRRSASRSDVGGPLSPVSALTNSNTQGQEHTRHPSLPNSATSGAAASSNKASLGGIARGTPRFVLHTDLDDANTTIDNNEVVELPPQYSDRRVSSIKEDQGRFYATNI